MERHYFDFPIRVLIYKEGRETVAHALEMDLLGYGTTEKAARADLFRLIESQLSFAAHKGNADLAYFPAPEELFHRWEEAQKARWRGGPECDKAAKLRTEAVVLTFSPSEIAQLSKDSRRFSPEPELVGA